MESSIKFKTDIRRVTFVPKFGMNAIKTEPTLHGISYEDAVRRGGVITRHLLSEVLKDSTYIALEQSDAVRSKQLHTTVTIIAGCFTAGHLFGKSSWHTPERLFSKTDKDKFKELYHLYKMFRYFDSITSSEVEGVHHPVYIDEPTTMALDLDKTEDAITKDINDVIEDRQIWQPPQIKVQIDGEIVCYGSRAIRRFPSAHSSGWFYRLCMAYTDRPPISIKKASTLI
jgi:hypothetical protein